MIDWGKLGRAIDDTKGGLMWVRHEDEDIVMQGTWVIRKKNGIPKRGMEVLSRHFDRAPRLGEGLRVEKDGKEIRKQVIGEKELENILWYLKNVEPGEKTARFTGQVEKMNKPGEEMLVYKTGDGEKIYACSRYMALGGGAVPEVTLDKTGYYFKGLMLFGRGESLLVMPIRVS